MSIKLLSAAWELDLPSTEKMVLMCLCDFARDDGGNCWPSIGTIARKCSKGKRTVQAAIRRLESAGFLTATERSGRSTSYHLDPRKICTPAETAPPQELQGTPAKSAPTPAKSAPNPLLNRQEPSIDCASGDAPPLTIDEVVADWNAMAVPLKLAEVRKVTKERRRAFAARLREWPDIEDWQRAFQQIRDTPWLHGKNDKGWKADFDFLLQAKSFTKLTEGAYGQAQH